jgi:hypothetical protein
MGAQDQRPRYYEGQFLTAADLDAAVAYQRVAQARHTLGAHTWGIAAGLTLRERAAPGAANRVEVILTPGLAWDGFGRAIVVDRPTRIAEDLFAGIPFAPAVDAPPLPAQPKGRLVKLWIGYEEVDARPPAAGFDACTDDPQTARVRETFRLYAGEFPQLVARRAPVTVGTETTDAEQALRAFDPAAPLLWDASVPHQRFPAERKPPRWLVPLGYVRWIAGDQAPGYLATRDLEPSDNAADRSRSLRRYLGVVTQNIESADGAVVVHRRDENPLIAHRLATLLAGGAKWDDLKKDLFWVEGNARIVGDAKLAGGALLFRNGNGYDEKTPIYLARHGDGVAADGNRELRAVIGPSAQYDNRFIVGPQQPGAAPPAIAPRLVVTSGAGPNKKDAEGRVGVNTRDPRAALEVVGDWDGTEDGALRLGGQTPTLRWTHGAKDADPSWRVQVGANDKNAWRVGFRKEPPPAWTDVLWVTTTASVGVGASDPRNPLGVRARGDWHELVSFEDPAGATKWHLNMKALGNGPGNTPGLNFSETGVADFRLFLRAGGDVGVGTMQPEGRLTVHGKVQPAQGQFSVFTDTADIEYDGGNDNLFIIKHDNAAGPGVTALTGCRFGVGSTTPFSSLAVRAVGNGEELVSFESPGGATTWHINQGLAGNPQRGLNFARTGVQDGRLFLAEGGNVGVGTTDPTDKLQVEGDFLTVRGLAGERAIVGGEGVSGVVFGTRNANVLFADMRRMNVPFNANSDAAWLTVWCKDVHEVSDLHAKTDIRGVSDALARVTQLRGVRFRWRSEAASGDAPARLGLVAQEVQEVVPEAVTVNERGAGISYSSLIPLLVEAIKELKQEVDTLRAEVRKGSAGAAKPAARAKTRARKA